MPIRENANGRAGFLYYFSVYVMLSKIASLLFLSTVFCRKRMQRYDKFPNRPNFSAIFLHKNTKKTEGMTSVKGKWEGSFYNIYAGAHVWERGGRPGGEAPGTAARSGGHGGSTLDILNKTRNWAPAHTYKAARSEILGRPPLLLWAAALIW